MIPNWLNYNKEVSILIDEVMRQEDSGIYNAAELRELLKILLSLIFRR
jgi:hypothetical protein